MSRNIAPIIFAIIAIFLSFKAFTFLLWKFSGDGGTLEITLELFISAVAILAGIGYTVGLVWSRISRSATDDDLKIVGGGVFGLTFLSGICFGGFCIPAAALTSVFSILYLVPTIIGLKIATRFISHEIEEE